MVRRLLVRGGLRVHEIDEDHGLQLHNLVVRFLEVLVHQPLDHEVEGALVLPVDEAIPEHPLALVHPHLAEVLHLRQRFPLAYAHALEHLRDVAHVEGVVRFRWGGEEVLHHRGVHVQDPPNHRRHLRRDVAGERREERADHRGEDPRQRFVVERRDEDQVEHAGVAIRDVVLPPSRRAHRGEVVDVHQRTEIPALAIVPPEAERRLHHRLPQDFDRRLRAVLLLHGHVQVVDHDQGLAVHRRPEHALAPAIQLRVDQVLHLRTPRLGRKPHKDRHVGILVHRQQLLLHVRSLASPRRSAEEELDFVRDAVADDVLVAHGVRGLDQQRVRLRRVRDLLVGNRLHPTFPVEAVHVPHEVEDQSPVWQRWVYFLEGLRVVHLVCEQFLQELGEQRLGLRRACGAARERDREDCVAVDHGDDVLRGDLRRGDVRLVLHEVLVLQRVPDQAHVQEQKTLHQVLVQRRRHHRALRLHVLDAGRQQPVGHFDHLALLRVGHEGWQPLRDELVHQVLKPHQVRLAVHHAVAGDGGRTGHLHVHRLDHDPHVRRHRDDFARSQTQLLVLVHHGVHVLDPNRVHRPVKHEPLPLVGLVPRELAEQNRDHAVRPLVTDLVEAAVEVAGRNALGIQPELVNNLARVHVAGIREVRQRLLQSEHLCGLPRVRQTDDHE
mmetsp:Transcript_19771/g.49773  ORF Transcript_19771/g.49773 Transcript_19771/m.49773 type:complete len:666 (+) Transcript_19771:6027-8024(+)